MYYEIQGAGEPLFLLHGGVGASEMFASVLPALAQNHRVIAVHLQGHGRTADTDRPLRFEYLADDVAGLMTQMGIPRADMLGYSLGGGVALRLAIQYPDQVRRLVLVSTPFRREGFYPEVLAAMNQMGPEGGEGMKRSPLARLYPGVNWSSLLTKLGDLLRQDYDWSSGVAAITAPTMLIFADADAIRPAHMVEFYSLLGGGQKDAGLDGSNRSVNELAILPGQTHYSVLTSPELATVVTTFLR